MSTRPRRTTTNQKDAQNDMLGLSREEERMLQRAMYDSLRQQNKLKLRRFGLSSFQKKSMTTRSMAVNRLSVIVSDRGEAEPVGETRPREDMTHAEGAKVEQEIKRGTRYSPMRKGPLSEMLKSLENKKTQIDITSNMILVKPLRKKILLKKKEDPIKPCEVPPTMKTAKVVIENLNLKRSGRPPKLIKSDSKRLRLSSPKSKTSPRLSSKSLSSSNKNSNRRTPRSASLAARSYWLSQVSDTSSSNKPPAKSLTPATASPCETRTAKPKSCIEDKATKPLVYNRKVISSSQRMSRNILATAAKRVKNAKMKSDVPDHGRRNGAKARTSKDSEAKNSMTIPPELWLDPKGQPVDTHDFINFLLYKDTPYLEPSLKWFQLPPHRRKQRFYKVIQSDAGLKFNETVVYTEKKEGGGKEVVVHCVPPKLVDEGSELVSSTSDQSSAPGEVKAKVSTSCNSSCHTHAAIDDAPLAIVSGDNEEKPSAVKSSPGPGRPKASSTKVSPGYEYRSKHIMQTRNRGI